MLGYVTLGSNQFDQAASFYDALFAVCGAKRLMELEGFILWGTSMEAGAIALTKPFNQEPASVGNGVMAAIRANSKEIVDAMHSKALALGGQCEGEPGPRDDGFYASYFRDLDGNKLAAFFIG
ncbi:VOC family protein [Congregibacter litoralis]|uniref:Putative lactoylglutathione lyase n=1 Tax=Congregibacter litoralis KT71 TaxID=314285 RepID=A4A7N7_9GAMM|nr:VOC family protein [Congregibacter litoralis]EAQ98306.1 putative lactoylglutathione lyase [Congregibacter litoralis KT71]